MDSEDATLQKEEQSASNPSTAFSFPSTTSAVSNSTTTLTLSSTTAGFTFSKPTSTFAFSNPSATFSFPNPSTTFSFSKPTTTLAASNPTSEFSFSNPTTTFAFPSTMPSKFHFDVAKSTGRQGRKFPTSFLGKNPLLEKRELNNAKENLALCVESSTQTETELCVDKLLQGLKEMLLNSKHSDFILNVKGKEFSVHKVILAAHSPVFAAMLEHDTKEAASGIANIDDFEPVNFSDFLNFLYSGKIENLNSDNVLYLYEVADKYQVTELNSLCIKYMINNISVENFCGILTLGLRHHIKELIDVTTQFFLQNSKEIAITAKWGMFLAENPVAGNELFLKVLDLKKL